MHDLGSAHLEFKFFRNFRESVVSTQCEIGKALKIDVANDNPGFHTAFLGLDHSVLYLLSSHAGMASAKSHRASHINVL
jgi:hypothetical protein